MLELAILAKLVNFVIELTLAEKIGVTAILIGLIVVVWRWAYGVGKHKADINLLAKMQELRDERRSISENLNSAGQQIRVLEDKIKVLDGNIIPDDLQSIMKIRDKITIKNLNVWELGPQAFTSEIEASSTNTDLKVVTVGNLKGGVGKTTLTSNLAAFFDIKLGKKVLLIDFDYQGSLSAVCLRSVGQEIRGSIADFIITGSMPPEDVLAAAQHLSPKLPRSCLIPASYTLAGVEDQSFLKWVFYAADRDVRFHLADTIWSPVIANSFDIVLIDVGPRLTTASINALFASTHFIVPTNLDRLSAETLGSFLKTVNDLKTRRSLKIELAGVVGTMAYTEKLTGPEQDALGPLRDGLEKWNGDKYIFKNHIRYKREIANNAGKMVAYFLPGDAGAQIRTWFDALGKEVAKRIGIES